MNSSWWHQAWAITREYQIINYIINYKKSLFKKDFIGTFDTKRISCFLITYRMIDKVWDISIATSIHSERAVSIIIV